MEPNEQTPVADPAAEPTGTTEAPALAPQPSEAEQRIAALEADLAHERRTNREALDRLARLEGFIDARGQRPAAPPPDPEAENNAFFEDPTGRVRNITKAEVQRALEAREAREFRARAMISAQEVIEAVGEENYLRAEDMFRVYAGRDPQLTELIKHHPSPARFAYEYVRKRQQSRSSGPSQREKELELEVERLRQQVAAGGSVPQLPTLPRTNAGGRTVGETTPPAPVTAQVLLDEILAD